MENLIGSSMFVEQAQSEEEKQVMKTAEQPQTVENTETVEQQDVHVQIEEIEQITKTEPTQKKVINFKELYTKFQNIAERLEANLFSNDENRKHIIKSIVATEFETVDFKDVEILFESVEDIIDVDLNNELFIFYPELQTKVQCARYAYALNRSFPLLSKDILDIYYYLNSTKKKISAEIFNALFILKLSSSGILDKNQEIAIKQLLMDVEKLKEKYNISSQESMDAFREEIMEQVKQEIELFKQQSDSGVKDEIEDIKHQIEELKNKIESLKSTMPVKQYDNTDDEDIDDDEDIEDENMEDSEDMEDEETNTSIANQDIQSFQDTITNLTEEVEFLKSKLDEIELLKGKLENTMKNISLLSIDSEPADTKELENRIANLETQVENLKIKLSSIPDINSLISQIKADIMKEVEEKLNNTKPQDFQSFNSHNKQNDNKNNDDNDDIDFPDDLDQESPVKNKEEKKAKEKNQPIWKKFLPFGGIGGAAGAVAAYLAHHR